MRLTGKASSYFYSWLHQRFHYEPLQNATSSSQWFNSLHPSMQWGILQDWAYHAGYEMTVYVANTSPLRFGYQINKLQDDRAMLGGARYFDTPEKAREDAVSNLDELINNEQ